MTNKIGIVSFYGVYSLSLQGFFFSFVVSVYKTTIYE